MLNEVRGVAREAELWALLPDGTQAKGTFGPEEHGGSTWNRPGDEWGTGFIFPKAGCWRLTLTRTAGSGYVLLPVG